MKINEHEFSREIGFNYLGQNWKIKKTRHLLENRNNSRHVRGEFLDNKRYIEIFKAALRNGLTSFRNNGPVVVTIPDYRGMYISILCKINSRNNISVITIFHEKNKFWKSFIKVQNRINILFDYVIPKMTEKERKHKDFEKVVNTIEINSEDVDFRYIMSSINDFIKIS